MRLKDKIYFIFNLKFFLIVFTLLISNKTFSSEKNFVVAAIDRSPITYFDLKQKAKLIHFLKNKNNDYKNLNQYFELSLDSLISQELLIKKAKEFNKNILKLTKKDASKYILERLFFFKKFSKTSVELLFLCKIYLSASFCVKSKIFLLNSKALFFNNFCDIRLLSDKSKYLFKFSYRLFLVLKK